MTETTEWVTLITGTLAKGHVLDGNHLEGHNHRGHGIIPNAPSTVVSELVPGLDGGPRKAEGPTELVCHTEHTVGIIGSVPNPSDVCEIT